MAFSSGDNFRLIRCSHRLKWVLVLLVVVFFLLLSLAQNSKEGVVSSPSLKWMKTVFIKQDDDGVLIPVHPEDLNSLPVRKGIPNKIQNTTWWRAIEYIDMDVIKRTVDYECKPVKQAGNWWICADETYAVKPPCLVYSFGINYDFSFDDAMAKLGCEVHSFDPSMNTKDHIRQSSVHFYQIGIANETSVTTPIKIPYVKDKRKWNMMTLSDIKKKLGHQSRNLDVLKMDIESYEWGVIENMIKENMFPSIKQFIVEYHAMPGLPRKELYPKLLRIYKEVHDLGMEKFKSKYEWVVRTPSHFRYQINVGYVNRNFKSLGVVSSSTSELMKTVIKQDDDDVLIPVHPEDLNNLPVRKGIPNKIQNTTWWRAIEYIDMDVIKRTVDYECKPVKQVGNWWICADETYAVKPPCLVYSFGIDYDFSFDDAMAKLGCEVHSFDPSMNTKDYIRQTSVHFYQIGIANETSVAVPLKISYVKDNRKWSMMTLSDIKKKLGHQSRNLDVLKMDIESYEWGVIENMIKDNLFPSIKQFIVEYHAMPGDLPRKELYPKLLRIYKEVHNLGMEKFRSNYEWVVRNPSQFRYQINVGYVNRNFKSLDMKQIFRS